MQPVVKDGVQRPIGFHGQAVDARGKLAQLGPLGGGSELRKQFGSLHFQRFAHDEVSADVIARGNADAGAGARPTFEQSFDLEPQQRLRYWKKAHTQLGRQLAARNHLPEPEFTAKDPLPDDVIGLGGQTGRS